MPNDAARTLPFVLHPVQAADIRGLSREARLVMSIGNPPPGPTGILGYMLRRDPATRAIRAAMDKIKSSSF